MKEKASRLVGVKRSMFMLLLFVMASFQVFAQTKEISGIVKDNAGEAAIGATVKVKGTTIGTITDFNGAYTLKDVPADANELEVSYIGFATKTVAISGSKVDVSLAEDTKQLEAVVVTGYGETKKRDLVNSVASVGADQLKDVPVASAAEAMQGKLAGVNVTTTEGSPDAEISVRVRGGSSLTQSADPLYIVDGFPVSSINDIPPSAIKSIDVLKDAAATAIYGAQGANGVIIITTKDGEEGASDSGKFKFNVDYTGYFGFKKMVNAYDMMDAEDFARIQYENAYFVNKDKIDDNFRVYFDKAYSDTQDYPSASVLRTDLGVLFDSIGALQGTDWQDKTFGRTGQQMNHSLSVTGGNKKANFALSYNRIDDEGIMYGSDYNRDNLSLKAKFKPIKNMTIGITGRYSNTEVYGAGANTADDAGSKTESRVRNAIAYTPIELLSKDVNQALQDEEAFGSLYDPITAIDDNYKYKTDEKWSVNGYVQYKFLKDYTFRSSWGYESQEKSTNRYYGNTAYYSRAGDGFTGAGGAAGYSSTIINNETSSKFQNSNTLTAVKSFTGGHSLTVLLGEETTMKDVDSYTQTTFGYDGQSTGDKVLDGYYDYLGQFTTHYVEPNDNMLSFFAKADYNYRSRYYLNATMRADGSTRFANNDSIHNQWGYFPSVSGAWRMSDEAWIKDALRAAKVSNLKWRLSYGVAGNNNVDLGYLYNAYIEKLKQTPASGTYVGSATYDLNVTANPELKWETTITRDLGLDYGFFKDRLSGAIDIYQNSTVDLIVLRKTGNSLRYENVGETQNRGAEFSVTGVILDNKSKNLKYNLTVDANASFNQSEVISFGGTDVYTVATGYLSTGYDNSDIEYKLEVGEPLGRVWGYEYDGFYTTSDFNSYDKVNDVWYKDGEEVLTVLADADGARPGMMKLKDLDGDGKITKADRTVIGNTMPLCTGGFSLSGNVGSGNWGTVDASANFSYSIGNDVVNLTALDLSFIASANSSSKLRNNLNSVAYGKRYSLFDANGNYLPAAAQTDATSGLTEGASYDLLAAELASNNTTASIFNPVVNYSALNSYFVEDGSYLRMAALTIGYSLPDKLINKAHISKLRFFFTASNLFCLTNYSGNDPEVDTGSARSPLASGLDFSAYPKSRAFNFGLNLSF